VIVAFYKAYPFWGLKNEVEKGKIPTLKAFGNFRQKVKSELFYPASMVDTGSSLLRIKRPMAKA